MGKKVEDLEGVRQALRQMLPDLQERYGVKSLGVFGSYVHGRQTRRSDVDLLVEFREDAPMSLFKFVALELELGKSLGHKVDLVERNTLRPLIGKRILDEVQPV